MNLVKDYPVKIKKQFWKKLELNHANQYPGGIWHIFSVKGDVCTVSRAELQAVGGNKRRYIKNVQTAWLLDAIKEYNA